MKRKKIPPAALAGMVVCGAAVVCKALQLAEAGASLVALEEDAHDED